jgi:hypothetical protein
MYRAALLAFVLLLPSPATAQQSARLGPTCETMLCAFGCTLVRRGNVCRCDCSRASPATRLFRDAVEEMRSIGPK